MIEGSHIAIASLAAIIIVGLRLFRGRLNSSKSTANAPENTAAQAALDGVQDDLQEELDRIRSATTGDSPANDLADLGNSRKRG